MKTLKKLSQKAADFCALSGYDVDKVRKSMGLSYFAVQKCETKSEMDKHGVDYNFPYAIYNPFYLKLTITE